MATTHIRHEVMLGAVRTVRLDEDDTAGQVVRVEYQLNIIDGWVLVREWSDESGIKWEGSSHTQSRVGAVLAAAPTCAEFIATSHLLWIKALTTAGRSRQASGQRRALVRALAHHGLELCADTSAADQSCPAQAHTGPGRTSTGQATA